MILSESQTIEFKQVWKDEYLKTICAFANGDGGALYIGIDDNGSVTGVNDAKKLLEVLPNKINNRLGTLVTVLLKKDDSKNYVEIIVQKTYSPISYNGKFYKRSGSINN